MKKQLIKYFKSLGIEVYTNTKARGHQGFFLKNRIDISKNTKEERIVPTLLHEFAHFIHDKLEKDMPRTGGTLEVLFDFASDSEAGQEKSFFSLLRQNAVFPRNDETLLILQKELLLVTNYVDENSLLHKLKTHKEQLKNKIKAQETIIKADYPKFMRSKKFKDFDRYIKKSNAKYLLKYDRVKILSSHFFKSFRKEEIFSIDNIEKDFPEMERAFCAYIRMKSYQKKQARNSARINYFNKYYSKPTELFARLVEGLYSDCEKTKRLAPLACERFFELLDEGYYFELKEVFEILQDNRQLATF